MQSKTKEQIEQIEELVKEDLTNGKTIQSKLYKQMKLKGICPKDITQKLQKIKSGE